MCLVVAKAADEYPGQYALHLCDSIGTIIESRLIEFQPRQVAICKSHVFCTSPKGDALYAWQYEVNDAHLGKKGLERVASVLSGKRGTGRSLP